jgi:4-amino-4-deoxy-L-arabinose transferase-like glycosyltransferase
LVLGVAAAFSLSKNKTWKQKNVIWGLALMFAIAPFLSWLVGMLYGIQVGDGFSGGSLMVILFPIIFIAGLVTLLVGIFGNEEKHHAKFK